jgi:galactonate dehydratase
LLETIHEHRVSRRRFLRQAAIGACSLAGGLAAIESYAEQAAADQASKAVIGPREPLKITQLETFIEEPAQSQNIDILAELAAKTHIPVATGERIYTKWGFREVLDKKAARILQPDMCYAGGITELRLIAGMAEAHYVPLAPHNPQGPCSLAASCQIAAAIPNFLIQEQGTRSHANLLKTPFRAADGYLPVPAGPGLGIEIDEEKFMALVGEPQAYRRSYDRDDGSVVDW